ncbi:MAG TPA: transposase [Acidocella sp.]|nr:transposase [Acidocella sp.]
MEIITGIERRRRWRVEEKLRIVAEAEAPGAVISLVAQRHGVARSQIFDWRRQVRSGALALVPVAAEFFRCG